MTMHKLINTAGEWDEAIQNMCESGDYLIVRDKALTPWVIWETDRGDIVGSCPPTEGWSEPFAMGMRHFASHRAPFLVLWWPGSVVIPRKATDS